MDSITNRSGGKRIATLLAVATSEGINSNNPEGGINHDLPDHDIIECIVDIANGNHKLGIVIDELGEDVECRIIKAFFDGAYDR